MIFHKDEYLFHLQNLNHCLREQKKLALLLQRCRFWVFLRAENCKFIYATNNLLKKEADKAGVMSFKIDNSATDNVSSFVNKYFVITGVSAGDSLEITCNSGGSDRGLQFGFDSGDQVLVPKSTAANDRSCVCHTVLPFEATNGVRFFAFGGTIYIDTITWIKA